MSLTPISNWLLLTDTSKCMVVARLVGRPTVGALHSHGCRSRCSKARHSSRAGNRLMPAAGSFAISC